MRLHQIDRRGLIIDTIEMCGRENVRKVVVRGSGAKLRVGLIAPCKEGRVRHWQRNEDPLVVINESCVM